MVQFWAIILLWGDSLYAEKSTLYRGGLLGCYLVADYRLWKTELWGKISTAFFSSIGIVVIFVIIVSVANSTLFNARAYSSQFIYTEKEFAEFEGSIDNIPLLDKASSDNIAKRKFGELTDYVSQYKIIDSEQIIYKGKPVRLSVLEHTSLWSWKRNKTTPGYILVDMQTH